MKKRFFIISALLFTAFGCKDITEINVEQKRPTSLPAEALMTSSMKVIVDNLASSNVNVNNFRLYTQQITETTYTDEANYDISTRSITNNWWAYHYRDVLEDLATAKGVISKDATLTAGEKANKLAIEDLLEVFTYSTLEGTFGNIPYKEALDFNNPKPAYDDAKTIHADLLKRLDADIAAINTSEASFTTADIWFGGDMAKWKTFANTLKLRLGMMLADVDAASAKTAVESAAKGSIASQSANLTFKYLSSPPNTNPIWVDYIQSGRKDFVAADTYVNAMKAVNDPRLTIYFAADPTGAISGGKYGYSNNSAAFSKVATRFTDPAAPYILADLAEVEFLLAEAVERGFSVGGTAESHYNAAITASLSYYGVSGADIATYLAQPKVAYTTATGNWKQKIGTQKWFALYGRGYESWTEWRRLDYPALIASTNAPRSGIPLRLTYPVTEQNLNKASYDAASTAIGGDNVATKLFWDKF